MFAGAMTLRTCLVRNARVGTLLSPLCSSSSTFAASSFSSYTVPPGQQSPRAYPTYSVMNPHLLFSMKLITPKFEIVRNVLTLPPRARGRILLEWVPRLPDGRINQDMNSKMSFALSAEEAGVILDQLPDNPVELMRRPQQDASVDPDADNAPQTLKVCRITPQEAGAVEFKCDFESNGIGGQPPFYGDRSAQGPMEATVQAGEFRVIREILRTSLPMLVGWQTMTDVSLQNLYNLALRDRQDGGGGYDMGANNSNNPYQGGGYQY